MASPQLWRNAYAIHPHPHINFPSRPSQHSILPSIASQREWIPRQQQYRENNSNNARPWQFGPYALPHQMVHGIANACPPITSREKSPPGPTHTSIPPKDADLEDCPICIDKMHPEDREDPIEELPCGHVFHGNCILKWLCNHDTCPMCRFKLSSEPDE